MNPIPKKHQIYATHTFEIPYSLLTEGIVDPDDDSIQEYIKLRDEFQYDIHDLIEITLYTYKKKFKPSLHPCRNYLIYSINTPDFKTSPRYIEFNISSEYSWDIDIMYDYMDHEYNHIEYEQFDEDK